ncbi:MAG: serine--tRNA ligase [Deltaproteobacteria bacterium]|nr:serine--tRNA ligase [Deltaproteobacteria bacterium]
MLDLRYVVAHADEIAHNVAHRHVAADVPGLVAAAEARSTALVRLEEVRRVANVVARQTGKPTLDAMALHAAVPEFLRSDLGMADPAEVRPTDRPWLVQVGKALKAMEPALAAEVDRLQAAIESRARQLPNLTHPDVPRGASDEDHRVLREVGVRRDFATEGFAPLDHVQLAEKLGLIDFEAGAKVAGQKFYFLQRELVLLDLALQRFAIDLLVQRGFTPMVTPDLARPDILEGIGFNPRGSETQVYSVAGHDLCLVGTAEITIGGMLADTILEAEQLPIRIAGISHCFRTEAGAAGRESRGLYRVHQFTKVEMFVFCQGDLAQSEAHHAELVAIEEELFTALEVPYRVLDICAGDLGAPAYRKFDLEAWMPGRGAWGEITSTSNCTDFQARRLQIRARPEPGAKPKLVHTLNGTAIALSRGLIAVLENHQQADGSIAMPKALRPYLPFDRIGPRHT